MRHSYLLNGFRTAVFLLLSAVLLIAMLNGCTLKKAMQMETFDDFMDVSNSVWTNLYFAFNEISIPGYGEVIYKNTVWKKKKSPVIVDENLYILPGVTLTIEPGVKVLLGNRVKLTCRGLIKAIGKEDAPIVFTWKTEGNHWDSIECINGIGDKGKDPGAVEFRHCIVEYGKGLRINSSHMEISNNIFRNNVSSAIQIEYAWGRISHNRVYANSTALQVESGNGGGIKVFTNRSVTIDNNRVHDNISKGGRDGGGGIYAFAYDGGHIVVNNNDVTNNRSDRKGGGIFAYDALVKANTVKDNVSAMTGGGIFALQSMAQDNVIVGNRSDEGGGVFSNNATVIHNLIRGNQAAKGAGIFHIGSGTLEKNTLTENKGAGKAATAAIVMLGNAPVRRNNIIAGDGYGLSFQSHSLSPDLDARENYWGTDDAKSIELAVYDWLEDSQVGLVAWKTYADKPIAEAYPFPEGAETTYTPVLNTATPEQVRGTIETDTVWGDGPVSDFTVVGNLLVQKGTTLTISKNTTLKINKGVSIRVRGKLQALGALKQPVVFTGNPDQPWGRLIFENQSLDATEKMNDGREQSVLAHCIVENGGGILLDGKGAELRNCRIRNNTDTGIRIKEVSATIKKCRIQNNVGKSDGGGIYAYGSWPIAIHDNVITHNRAKDGGGIFAYGYQSNVAVDMRNNVIEGNHSEGDGGGIWASRAAVVANTLADNTAGNRGGGLFTGFALVHDNTVSKNSAQDGGGIYAESNNRLIGNLIEKNTSQSGMGGGVYLNYWGLSTDNKAFSNNVVQGNLTPEGKGTGGICINGMLDFSRNAVFSNTGIQLNNLNPSSAGTFEAKNCFWGTTDLKKIGDLVYDGKDDPSLAAVDYKPVAQTKAVTRKKNKAAETTP